MPGAVTQVLAVAAAGRICAVPIAHVLETMRALPIAKVAGVPPFVLGLSVIRGEPTPVVDLGVLLEGNATEPKRLVTLELDGRCVALAVENVVGVRTLADTQLGELPPLLRGADARLVDSIGTSDQQLLVVLHAARLIPDDVWSSLHAAAVPA